jgi:hypothetical protein
LALFHQSSTFVTRVGVVAAVAATVGLSAIAGAVGLAVLSGTEATAATPQCATAGLVIWFDPVANGAAGTLYYDLELTNLSGHTCTLSGYPGVSAVNLQDQQIGSPASRNGPAHPPAVTLTPGSSATASLGYSDVVSSSCASVSAAGLRVYPPNQTSSKVVPFPFRACTHAGQLFLRVGPVGHYTLFP